MSFTRQSDWKPRGVEGLETAAEMAVRSEANYLVVAGPGAGKTELLAQRACYLLETATCPTPHRILAISFKRDAAKNLEERVRRRCVDHARRFDSLTLDAFGKSIVDRFQSAIPKEWRPPNGYSPKLTYERANEMRAWFNEVPIPAHLTKPNFAAANDTLIKRWFEICQYGHRLPFEGIPELRLHYAETMWKQALAAPPSVPTLSFPMLNRIASLLLRTNPKLLRALRATYSHVFMDEFQDTTEAQYDLVQSAFHDSATIITAVGDSKQKIMTWAGAMDSAFERFQHDFRADRFDLVRNYRSSPALVRIQHHIAEEIESQSVKAEPAKPEDGTSNCVVMEFPNHEIEAQHLSELISDTLAGGDIKPRDICILARQQAVKIIEPLRTQLQNKGIKLRDESILQDLLCEPVTDLILTLLTLATKKREPKAWDRLVEHFIGLTGSLDEDDHLAISESTRVLEWTRSAVSNSSIALNSLPAKLLEQIGEEAIKSSFAQYSKGDYLAQVVKSLGEQLASQGTQVVSEAVEQLIGQNSIPAMTIHKSKGLEFHTVIFIGLEDSQLWNFASQTEEEVRGFFVAFSRAIHRVIFTFANVRDVRNQNRPQSRNEIKTLYNVLQRAGVRSIRVDAESSDGPT